MRQEQKGTDLITLSTATMNEEMKHTGDIENLLKKNRKFMVRQNLRDCLDTLLMKKGITIAEVARGSQIDRSYVCQIKYSTATRSRRGTSSSP